MLACHWETPTLGLSLSLYLHLSMISLFRFFFSFSAHFCFACSHKQCEVRNENKGKLSLFTYAHCLMIIWWKISINIVIFFHHFSIWLANHFDWIDEKCTDFVVACIRTMKSIGRSMVQTMLLFQSIQEDVIKHHRRCDELADFTFQELDLITNFRTNKKKTNRLNLHIKKTGSSDRSINLFEKKSNSKPWMNIFSFVYI